MQQILFFRSKTVKLTLIIIIFLLFSALLFISDTIVSKIHPRQLPASCILCPYYENISFSNTSEIIHFSTPSSKYSFKNSINVVSFLSHVNRNPSLKSKFTLCLASLFKYATPSLHLHILTDDVSLSTAVEILQKTLPLANTSVEVMVFVIL